MLKINLKKTKKKNILKEFKMMILTHVCINLITFPFQAGNVFSELLEKKSATNKYLPKPNHLDILLY